MMKKILLSALGLLFVVNAHAGTIGVWGGSFSTMNAYIGNAGHTAVQVGSSSSAADLAGLDQVWLIRQQGDADLINYVQNGGTLVTEYSSGDWVVDAASLLDADATGLGMYATATQISFTQEGVDIGLGDSTGNPYSNTHATEFFYSFSNLGSDVDVVATITGHNVGISGAYGAGNILALGWDWQDSASNTITQRLVNDITSVEFTSVPEPMSLALFGFGLVGFGITAKGRKSA